MHLGKEAGFCKTGKQFSRFCVFFFLQWFPPLLSKLVLVFIIRVFQMNIFLVLFKEYLQEKLLFFHHATMCHYQHMNENLVKLSRNS